jgi:hypothetical protein
MPVAVVPKVILTVRSYGERGQPRVAPSAQLQQEQLANLQVKRIAEKMKARSWPKSGTSTTGQAAGPSTARRGDFGRRAEHGAPRRPRAARRPRPGRRAQHGRRAEHGQRVDHGQAAGAEHGPARRPRPPRPSTATTASASTAARRADRGQLIAQAGPGRASPAPQPQPGRRPGRRGPACPAAWLWSKVQNLPRCKVRETVRTT